MKNEDNEKDLAPREMTSAEAAERRRQIEHTQHLQLTPEEIAERKRAHAEARQKQKMQKKRRQLKDDGKRREEEKKGGKPSKKNKKDKRKKKDKKTVPETAEKKRLRRVEPPAKDETPEEPVITEKPDADMEDFRRARAKLKNRKRIKRLIILLIIAAIAAAIYFTRGLWLPKFKDILNDKHETIVNDGTTQAGNFPIDMGDENVRQITRLDGSIIVVDGSHITTYDTNGKLRESVYHSYGSPVVRSEGRRMLCFDHGGTGFRLYGKNGTLFEKNSDSSVLLGDIAPNGNVLVVTEDDKYSVMLTVYDKNGTELYRWQNGDRILDACFGGDGSQVVITTFEVRDGEYYSTVHCADITRSDAVTESDAFSGLVMRCRVNTEGNIWVMREDSLVLLSGDCKQLDSFDFSDKPDYFELSSSAACAALKKIGGGMTVYLFNGTDVTLSPRQIDVSENIRLIRSFDDMVFLLGESKLDAYAPDGSLVSTAAVTPDHKDMVYSENAVYFVDRREINKLKFKT